MDKMDYIMEKMRREKGKDIGIYGLPSQLREIISEWKSVRLIKGEIRTKRRNDLTSIVGVFED